MHNSFDTIKLELPLSQVMMCEGFFCYDAYHDEVKLQKNYLIPGLSEAKTTKNRERREVFVLTISSKILGKDCLSLIDQDNILQVYEAIMTLGYFRFSLESFLNGKTCRLDPCRDVLCESIHETIEALARYNSKAYLAQKPRTKQRSAEKCSINICKKDVNGDKAKITLKFYDKGHELGLRKNRALVGGMPGLDRDNLLNTAKNKLRVEIIIDSHEKIRERLKIQELTLRSALASEENVLHTLLEEIMQAKPKVNMSSNVNKIRDYERQAVLALHQNCLESIRAELKTIVGSHNLSVKMQPYEELHARINNSAVGTDLVLKVLEKLAY